MQEKKLPDHPGVLADLRKSGLTDQTILEMGVTDIETKEQLQEIIGYTHTNKQLLLPAYQIPYPQEENPFARIRLLEDYEDKDGKIMRYRQPKGVATRLYYLPKYERLLSSVKKPLYITEGEKKAARLQQELSDTAAVVGAPGITQWQGEDLKSAYIKNRKVVIAYDQEWEQNPNIANQLISLWIYIYKRGGVPVLLTWKGKGLEKIDDYLAAGNSLDACIEKQNLFTVLKNVNAKDVAKYILKHGLNKDDLSIMWDRYNMTRNTKINKATIKSIVARVRREEAAKDLPSYMELNDKDKQVINTGLLTVHIIEEVYKENLVYQSGDFWTYDEEQGIWKEEDILLLAKQVKNAIPIKLRKKKTIEDVVYQLKVECTHRSLVFNKDENLLKVKNGVLDIETKELTPPKPEHYHTGNVEIEYDARAECPRFMRFLDELMLDPKTQLVLQKWFGYSLTKSCKAQKSLMLLGEGSNGKSTLLDIWAKVLGKENCVTMDVTKAFNRFNVVNLRNKNVCFGGDIAESVLSPEYKDAVNGGILYAEKKGKDGKFFNNTAKFIFDTNRFLPTKDKSHGYYRRFHIIRFERRFSEAEQNPNLLEELSEELPGILNWALEGLELLKADNMKIEASSTMNTALEDYKEFSNPLQTFINDRCERTGSETFIRIDDLFATYKDWCIQTNHKILSRNRFSSEMGSLGFSKKRETTAFNGKRHVIIKGISLLSSTELAHNP